MKKIFLLLSTAFSLLSICSCGGGNGNFQIKGKVPGLGTQNLKAFYCSEGSIKAEPVTVANDKFTFEGESSAPAIIEIYTSDRILIGRVIAENGDRLECVLDSSSPYKILVKGNKAAQRLAAFYEENGDVFATKDPRNINRIVAEYVSSHKEDIVSTVLLVTEFYSREHESTADSLLSTINPDARPQSIVTGYEAMLARTNGQQSQDKISSMTFYTSKDTLNTYNPFRFSYSLLYFSSADKRNREIVAKGLRQMREQFTDRRLAIVDISLDQDTAIWKKSIASDSATWLQCWTPGSVAARQVERLGVPRLPFFIVADSTGQQLYRGTSFSDAEKLIKNLIK